MEKRLTFVFGIGFIVVGIDYFEGDPIYPHIEDPNFDRAAWLEGHQKGARELEPVWWEAIRARYGELANSDFKNK